MRGLPAPLIDIPETQTVAAGQVAAVLTRYAGPGPWERISRYYELADGHRVRDFQNPVGEVWSACELLVATFWGYRVRLAVFPKRDFEECLKACCQQIQPPVPPEA